MKKIILSLAVVFVMSSFTTANTNVEKIAIEDFGKASECVEYAKGVIFDAAEEYNLDLTRGTDDYRNMMDAYNAIYADCYNN